MSGAAISTRGLVHIYRSEGHDVAALSGVDLSVRSGEMIGLLGPSGAGKSTLLTLLGGLFRPSAGKIYIGDHELTALTVKELDRLRAREVSLMLQGASRNLLPYLTPRQNVEFAQRAARRDSADLPDVGEVLDRVGLSEYADHHLSGLTPGHLQLAAVAVAIATDPGVVLADEPTSQLDHEARDTVLKVLADISAQQGTTVVLVTHDPQVAAVMPRTITIRDGRIGGEGRAGEEYAVVTADGFVHLPDHALAALPPGTLVRVHDQDGIYQLIPEHEAGGTPGATKEGS
ncbi:ABC transporter ATP-binding protein [Leekyejoonella antrihumi]|uniref:ATP-binding cassette domain-containing protein n=1 Tax=Leekyejoonella antrihumi TaxID=1660198 RepID=A0A563E7N2_9MICO|nr:ATP-binding cassette domain-containing protein [Leekyejoonella antrihumi]TWP38212.1 ATP-binding cassette domain-containing protein [Leekyejoonella antrihumi]